MMLTSQSWVNSSAVPGTALVLGSQPLYQIQTDVHGASLSTWRHDIPICRGEEDRFVMQVEPIMLSYSKEQQFVQRESHISSNTEEMECDSFDDDYLRFLNLLIKIS